MAVQNICQKLWNLAGELPDYYRKGDFPKINAIFHSYKAIMVTAVDDPVYAKERDWLLSSAKEIENIFERFYKAGNKQEEEFFTEVRGRISADISYLTILLKCGDS